MSATPPRGVLEDLYQSVVISPDDYAMRGFQPLSSRSYFAVKLTNVFVYVGALTTLLGLPSIVVHLVRGGLARGIAALAAVYGATASITLAMVVAYAGVALRPPESPAAPLLAIPIRST